MMGKLTKNIATRQLTPKENSDGTQEWYSITHAANIGGEIDAKPHLPGIIIFVHGVNSEGEWYEDAEKNICSGLNTRLNLTNTPYQLKENIYYKPEFQLDKKNLDNSRYIYKQQIRTLKELGNSPVVRFYWGYRATEQELGQYLIPLRNITGDSYYHLAEEIINPIYSSPNKTDWTLDDWEKHKRTSAYHSLPFDQQNLFIKEQLKEKGPFFWGGGPFQNGCNNLVSLWSEQGFSHYVMLWSVFPTPVPFNIQLVNPELNRLLAKAPPRKYCAHAVNRLAQLIKRIRENNKHDTVTVIGHSQGTMIALAAAAIEAPDALFVLNSPYAIVDVPMNSYAYSFNENINPEVREATLRAIINNVAENKNRLNQHPCRYAGLVVGLSSQKKSWSPNCDIAKGFHQSHWLPDMPASQEVIHERDNHGRTYIYCNPHDRVMGSAALLSIGWNGLPNQLKHGQITPHTLFSLPCPPYLRMLARSTPCGYPPNAKTLFTNQYKKYADGQVFWDNTLCATDKMVWPTPDANITLNINAPEVPQPIEADELILFDEGLYPLSAEINEGEGEKDNANPENIELGYGYGEIQYNRTLKKYEPVDSEYYYYKDLLAHASPKTCQLTKEEQKILQSNPLFTPQERHVTTRDETQEEIRAKIRRYIARPTDHGTLPRHALFLRRVLSYDLPIGYCEIGKCPEKMCELRRYADWLSGEDDYLATGELTLPIMPDSIRAPLKK